MVAFVILSLAPTAVLFFAAFQFVGTSMEYWFSAQVEQSLFEATEVTEGYNQQLAGNAAHFAEIMARELPRAKVSFNKPSEKLAEHLEDRRDLYGLAAVRVFAQDLTELAYATQSGTHISHVQAFPLDLVKRAMEEKRGQIHLQPAPTGDFAAAVEPIKRSGKVVGAVAVFRLLPPGALARTKEVRKGLEDYRQLKAVKNPIPHQSIHNPVHRHPVDHLRRHLVRLPVGQHHHRAPGKIAKGTQRVAEGDYDFFVDAEGPDEIGTLVNAFNRMTADLKTSKASWMRPRRRCAAPTASWTGAGATWRSSCVALPPVLSPWTPEA